MARANYYAADYEATTCEPTHTYSFGIVKMGKRKLTDVKTLICPENPEHLIRLSIDLIFSLPKKSTIFFHNLSYDASFILSYLFRETDAKVKDCLIIGMMKSIVKINIEYKGKEIILRDSYCLFNAPLSDVLKNYTNLSKGETPLHETLADVEYTPELDEYQRIDCLGLSIALEHRLQFGNNAITTAGGALKEFRAITNKRTKDNYNLLFPLIEKDVADDIRKSYRGGFTYLNPIYKDNILKNVKVIDVNSMYPAQMKDKMLPIGVPQIIESGEVVRCRPYPLGIQRFRFSFCEVRDGYIPFLTRRNTLLLVSEYLELITEDEPIEDRTFTLTCEEFELFKKSYNCEGLELLGGYLFRGQKGLFNDYISKFWELKTSSNPVEKSIGKLFLNSLYGKFGEAYTKQILNLYYDAGVHAELVEEIEKPCGYIPMATYITSYSRLYLIETILKIGKDSFVYSDTDSIHYLGELPESVEIHDTKLGAWKVEKEYTRCKYIRAKRYMGIKNDGSTDIACAGINKKDIKRQIKTLEMFSVGNGVNTFEMKTGVNGKYTRKKVVRI